MLIDVLSRYPRCGCCCAERWCQAGTPTRRCCAGGSVSAAGTGRRRGGAGGGDGGGARCRQRSSPSGRGGWGGGGARVQWEGTCQRESTGQHYYGLIDQLWIGVRWERWGQINGKKNHHLLVF